MRNLPHADLTLAFGRIEAFLAVQDGARGAQLARAVECLQAAAGIGAEERRRIAFGLGRLEAVNPRAGDVMLGVIVGLLAAHESSREVSH